MTKGKLGTKVFLVLERHSPTWQGRPEIGKEVMARGEEGGCSCSYIIYTQEAKKENRK